MGSCWQILIFALLIPVAWSYPHHPRPTCSACLPGTKVLHACSPRSNTVCTPCESDTYSDAPSNATECQHCSRCPKNTYISKPCSRKSDTVCSPCSTSPQTKSKYYLASCDNAVTVSDLHDIMMGDDAAADPLAGGDNNEEVPVDDVKEEGEDNNADEVKDVGNKNKDDVPDTANNEHTADDIDNEKKDEPTNDAKEVAGNSEDTADHVDNNKDGVHEEHKAAENERQSTEGEMTKEEKESEHGAPRGDEAAHNAAGEARHDAGDKTAPGTLDETAPGTLDETSHNTADETAHDTPDKTAQDNPDDSTHDTPDKTALDTPDDTAHDTPDDTAHDTPDDTAHDTPDDTAHNTGDETAHDTPDDTAHDTPDDTAHDTPDDTAHDTPDYTAHDTPDDTAHDTPDDTAHDTEDKKAHGIGDETTGDTDDTTGAEPGDVTGDETAHVTEGEVAGEKPGEPSHDTIDGTGDDLTLNTGDKTADDAGDKTEDNPEDNPEDKATNETGDETTGGETPGDTTDETGGDSTLNAGDKTADGDTGKTEDTPGDKTADGDTGKTEDTPGDITADGDTGKTEDTPGDKTTNETGDNAADETEYVSEDDTDLNSPRVLEPEHKEFTDDNTDENNGANDTVVLAPIPDTEREHPADSNSVDATAESTDSSVNTSDEHGKGSLSSTLDHAENTTGEEETDGTQHLTQTGKPAEEATTESPEDQGLNLHLLHVGNEGPDSDDSENKTTEALVDTAEVNNHEPALGRILSGEITNTTQEEEIGRQGENSTAAPQTDDIVVGGVIGDNQGEKTETGLTDEVTTAEPAGTSESADGITDTDIEVVPIIAMDDNENTTVPLEHSTEGAYEPAEELTITTEATDDNSTLDDSKLGSVVRHDVADDETTDRNGTEATTQATAEISSVSAEEASTTKTQDEGVVAHAEGVEDVEVVTISLKTTKRIPTLEELEAQYTEQDSGSGEDYVTINFNGKDNTTKSDSTAAENIPLSGEQTVDEGSIASSHDGASDEEHEDNKRTAIIVGVTVGGIGLFALAFLASRYYKKRRGHFKEMKKVNNRKDGEALEFEPLKSRGNNIYNDPEIPPTNGIYRPRGKTSPSFPLKNKKEDEKVEAADLYAVPEKSKRVPLLGVSPPVEELSQSPSAQEPLISGVEKLKYIDDSTDDEYVNTVRTSLLPSRSPASRLSNVVEETPPTSPSIIQPYRPNWPSNQSKSGASSSHTNGSTPKQTHSSVSSQGSLTNDVMNALSNQMEVKTDSRNKGGRIHRKQVPSDEDIEC